MAGKSGARSSGRAACRRNQEGSGRAPVGIRNSGVGDGSKLEFPPVPGSERFPPGPRRDSAADRTSHRIGKTEEVMRIWLRMLARVIAGLSLFPAAHKAPAQTPASGTEIPLQHCDRLPIVILRA